MNPQPSEPTHALYSPVLHIYFTAYVHEREKQRGRLTEPTVAMEHYTDRWHGPVGWTTDTDPDGW